MDLDNETLVALAKKLKKQNVILVTTYASPEVSVKIDMHDKDLTSNPYGMCSSSIRSILAAALNDKLEEIISAIKSNAAKQALQNIEKTENVLAAKSEFLSKLKKELL